MFCNIKKCADLKLNWVVGECYFFEGMLNFKYPKIKSERNVVKVRHLLKQL